jgi:ketosteroid isomerase-like protein
VNEERRTLIRGLYDAMNRREVEALERLGRRFPHFEWRSAPDEIDSDTRRGAASALAYSRNILELFADMQTTIEEEIELGPDQLILVVFHDARGAMSGVQTGRREAHLWTYRPGGAVSLHEYATIEDALEAGGR